MGARRRALFGRQIVRTRTRIEMKGRQMAFNAIKKQYKTVFDMVGLMSPATLLDNVDMFVKEAPIRKFIVDYYMMMADIAMMYRNYAQSTKIDDAEYFTNRFLEKMRSYALVEAGKNVVSITGTSETFIRGAIESAMVTGTEQGLGIPEIGRLIRRNLSEQLGEIGVSRAKTIAQTEMIISSNVAAQDGINSTGFDYRKFWSNSGLKGVRGSHIFAQDNYPNGIAKEESFDMGNGNVMRFVGDPQGEAAELVNCRCTTLYEVI